MNVKDMLNECCQRRCALALWIVCVFALSLQWWLAFEELGGYGGFFVHFVKSAGDVFVILLPYWFLKPRWRWMVLLPVFLMSAWWASNLVYFRFFSNLLPPECIMMGGNVDSTLIHSAVSLLRGGDLWFAIVPVAAMCVYALMRRKISSEKAFSGRTRLLAVVASVFIFLVCQLQFSISSKRYRYVAKGERLSVREATVDRLTVGMFGRVYDLKINGLVVYGGKSLCQLMSRAGSVYSMDGAMAARISDYLRRSSEMLVQEGSSREVEEGVVYSNSAKNIVFVVVESLNSDVLSLEVSGNEVSPVLSRLVDDDGNLCAVRVVSQVKDGWSGDGQLIYNTGLLPLDSGSAAITVGSLNRFETLPRRSGRGTCVVFTDRGESWNEWGAYTNYGFDELYSNRDFADEMKLRGGDAAMFGYACDWIENRWNGERPFFLELLTASMHVPFNDPGVEPVDWLENAGGMDDMRRDYLRMVNYFDRELGRFLGWLEEKGLSESTMVVIAADHCQTVAADKAQMEANGGVCYIPVIIVNGGVGGRIDRVVGQVDLYPTLLQLLGLVEPGGYNGLGRSMLDPRLRSATDGAGRTFGEALPDEVARQREAFEVSNNILRGDYFRCVAQGE